MVRGCPEGYARYMDMITGTYDLNLVAASYIIAAIASYTALELSIRVVRHEGRLALYWLVAGGMSMGLGIWTMHFVGMLAYEIPMTYTYDVPSTVLSLVVGILASGFAIWIASRDEVSYAKIGISGIILGTGIAGMHYVGMAAVRIAAEAVYSPSIFVASIVVAIVAATAAIWIIFKLAHDKSHGVSLVMHKLVAALIMGLAVCGMHYTGMAAVSYEPHENAFMLSESASNPSMVVVLIVTALVIIGVTHLTIFFDVQMSAEQQRGLEAEKHASQMSELLDESLNEMFVIDIPTLCIQSVNKGACDNLGYSRDQLKTMSPMDVTPGLTEEQLCDRLMNLAVSKYGIDVYESVHQRADGSTYPVEVNLQLSNILERPVALAIVSDISERKMLETQLSQAQKLESIGQLAAGIAHEINTPAQYVGDNTRFIKETMIEVIDVLGAFQRLHAAALNGDISSDLIRESGELIHAVDPEYLAEEVPAAIEQSIDGITRITNIVRAMKEFSHPGGKNQELVDINKTVQSTITVASNEWKYVADVETDFDESMPAVPCMPQEISQVVLNLIVNGAHAIADVLKEGDDTKGTIKVSTACTKDRAEIRISDTGGGIPDHIKDRVFDPFFTTKDVGKGTGQGLSMAYKTIVNGHKGDLSFKAKQGEGTTFLISLPLDVDQEEPVQVVA